MTYRKNANQEACVLVVPWVINCLLSLTQESPVFWQNPQNNNNLTPQLASMKKIPGTLQNLHLHFFTSLYPYPLQRDFSATATKRWSLSHYLWILCWPFALLWPIDHGENDEMISLHLDLKRHWGFLSVSWNPASAMWTNLKCLLEGENHIKESSVVWDDTTLDQPAASQAPNMWEPRSSKYIHDPQLITGTCDPIRVQKTQPTDSQTC